MKLQLESTQAGATTVKTIGAGKPLIVVHGGPGLEHSYLVDWLRPLASSRKLYFYDQWGSGEASDAADKVTAQVLVEQFVSLVKALAGNSSIDVLTHSWGAYLLYEGLCRERLPINQAILCSPVGLTRDRFDESGERLMSRIPADVASRIEECDKNGDGVGLMTAALPYYVADPANVPLVEFLSYSGVSYAKVIDTLGPYDCRSLEGRWMPSALLIYGDSDIEIASATREIHHRVKVDSIRNAGHFAFAEQPMAFLSSAENFLHGS